MGLNLMRKLRRSIVEAARRRGYDIVRISHDAEVQKIFAHVRPYTMTSIDRIEALCRAVQYVSYNNIPGAIVECGVYHGGSMMAAALTLLQAGSDTRRLHLFDTFEGMSAPTDADVNLYGVKAADMRDQEIGDTAIPLEMVQAAMRSTGYPADKIEYVVGKVEDTLPQKAPQQIALLRLDTDYYESTYHEMVHLFPRLSPRGVLIIDDYGHWQGARKAIDQYIREQNLCILLSRIDYSGVMGVKAEV